MFSFFIKTPPFVFEITLYLYTITTIVLNLPYIPTYDLYIYVPSSLILFNHIMNGVWNGKIIT
jgi:hypothetical protein